MALEEHLASEQEPGKIANGKTRYSALHSLQPGQISKNVRVWHLYQPEKAKLACTPRDLPELEEYVGGSYLVQESRRTREIDHRSGN